MARRGGQADWTGARLPVADSLPAAATEPCDLDPRHAAGIRFELHRYGRVVGQVRLCGSCFQALNPRGPVDPLDVTEAA